MRRVGQLVSNWTRAEESRFLRQLETVSVPRRVAGLVREPDLSKLTQLIGLGLLTVTVGLSYFYAMLRR
jgi:hypothetical protein